MENNQQKQGIFSPGRIILFISFIGMFVILLNKSASHGEKAVFVIFCFLLMCFGVLLDTNFIERLREARSEGNQRLR